MRRNLSAFSLAARRAKPGAWAAALFAVVTGGGVLVLYPDVQQALKGVVRMPESLPYYSVAIGVLIAWLFVVVCLLARQEMTAPRIFFEHPWEWSTKVFNKEKTEVRVPVMSFISTAIRNDPLSHSSVAKPVIKTYCIAEFFAGNGEKKVVEHARWQEGEKPRFDHFPDNQQPIFRHHMNFIELPPNGDKYQIDFALKDEKKDQAFGFPASAQDLYEKETTWQSLPHELPKGRYRVELTIRGNEIDPPYPKQTLLLENPGAGQHLRVTWPEYEEAKNWIGVG